MSARYHWVLAALCSVGAVTGMLAGASDARIAVGLICSMVNVCTASILEARK